MSSSQNTPSIKTPWHLWVVAILTTLWNSVGAMDFIMTMTQNEAYMKSFTEEQLEYFYNFPTWVNISWGIATIGGAFGSLLLLLKQKLAFSFFAVSLVGLLVTTLHNYVLSNGYELMGGIGPVIFSIAIFVIALFLVIYSRSMIRRGILG